MMTRFKGSHTPRQLPYHHMLLLAADLLVLENGNKNSVSVQGSRYAAVFLSNKNVEGDIE